MHTFDVQSIEIAAPFFMAFRYIADPANLPEWTHAFKQVEDGRATMETPLARFRSAWALTRRRDATASGESRGGRRDPR